MIIVILEFEIELFNLFDYVDPNKIIPVIAITQRDKIISLTDKFLLFSMENGNITNLDYGKYDLSQNITELNKYPFENYNPKMYMFINSILMF